MQHFPGQPDIILDLHIKEKIKVLFYFPSLNDVRRKMLRKRMSETNSAELFKFDWWFIELLY